MSGIILICARGGSKGVPNKNIKLLNGKPLIAYTIEIAKTFATKYNFEIELSTDSEAIVNIINFRRLCSYLPVDTVIMAGGKGTRLMPMTKHTPKPLLKVGGKPIIEHNIDRLAKYGIDDFWISVNYLGEQIENYFKNGREKNISIDYVWEKEPLGT